MLSLFLKPPPSVSQDDLAPLPMLASGGEVIHEGNLTLFYRMVVVSFFAICPSYFWYRWLYTIEWDLPYRF